ncbi:MAG: GntP family permease [Planctomycetes bacterium]|nr:GntP family permease [Planctomycetota bacterium]
MTVVTNHLVALLGFAGVLVLLLFLIAKWKWHVFLAMLVPILIFGIIPGIQKGNFIAAFESGFGKTLGKIGVVIVLGSIIAEALKHTGAIQVITRSMVKAVGSTRMPLALTLTGFVLGIAIFSDVAYVILNPLVHASAHAMKVSIGVTSIGLVGALQLTHAIVPPTPGPLAAAALLGADIAKTIFFGGIACLVGSLASWIWGQFVAGPIIKTLPSPEFAAESLSSVDSESPQPTVMGAYAPIVVPILLISLPSVIGFILPEENALRELINYLGWPVVALTIGVWLAFQNIKDPNQKKEAKDRWVKDGLRVSAMILVVTGLGGSLSAILKGTPAVDTVSKLFVTMELPAILLPFVIGIIGNMITGSTTVGVITAASLVAPMLDSLGLSPEAAMLAAGSGSVMIKYVNSSYFWVCTSLSKLSLKEALLGYGGVTFVGGAASFAAVYVMWIAGVV